MVGFVLYPSSFLVLGGLMSVRFDFKVGDRVNYERGVWIVCGVTPVDNDDPEFHSFYDLRSVDGLNFASCVPCYLVAYAA